MKTVFIDSMNQLPETSTDIWSKFYNVMFNTENLVFNEYCKRELKYEDVYKIGRCWEDASRDQVYVLPLSNNLSIEDTYFTRMLYRIAKYNLNIVPVGLGVQANLGDSPKEFVKRLPGRKIRLFQKMAANTTTLGVRGSFTAECLRYIGIHNVRVIGCPSFYGNLISKESCNVHLNVPKSKKVCINWDFNSKDAFESVNESIEIKKVIQTMPEWIKWKNDELRDSEIFFSIDDWSKWIRENKFAIAVGNRFHGNMICYLNGIPTFWIAKDNRILELADTLGLPSCILGKRKCDINDFLENNFYTDGFYQKRRSLRDEYIHFLNENRICHKFEME